MFATDIRTDVYYFNLQIDKPSFRVVFYDSVFNFKNNKINFIAILQLNISLFVSTKKKSLLLCVHLVFSGQET